jgi:predicted transcriptional regulator
MKALVSGPVDIGEVTEAMGRSQDISMRLVEALLDEGLIRRSGDVLHL